MPIMNDNKYKVDMYPSMILVEILYEFVNGEYWYGVEDDYIKDAALSSSKSLPETALHKILYYLAYIDFYLYKYDDRDWVVDEKDAIRLFESWIPHMGMKLPHHYKTLDGLTAFLTKEKFLLGLNRIVDSAFSILWTQKEILYKFNLLLAEYVKDFKKKDYPKILEEDGVIDRDCQKTWPKWLKKQILFRDRGFCQYCGKRVSDNDLLNDDYDIDHMVPLKKGGTYDPTNLILACSHCNRSKGKKYKPVTDFFTWPNRKDFNGI